jgi:tRNA-2-methylthio-N6-dimethylallyladenosine synthase
MRQERVYIETWGCQMNLHQSEGITGVLEREGYAIVDSLDDADVVLFNTCSVREKAEEKVIGRIGAVAVAKRSRAVLFGLGGCMAPIHGEGLLKRLKTIDFLFGTQDLPRLPALLREVGERGRRADLLPAPQGIAEVPCRRSSRVTAMVSISEGCSTFCAYCIVPFARGPLRSRRPERILAEVEGLVRDGTKEVLLLGQNVDAYGRDEPPFGDFASLLDRVAQTGVARVRFLTSHPRDLSPQEIEAIARHPNVCKHLHLACQSGSDRVLAAMNRGYTRAEFLSIVSRARRAIPGLRITTDLIVGYPGETQGDLEATLDLVEEVRFGAIFAAKYSPRPGTQSVRLADDVPEEAKDARLQEVLCRARRIALEENERVIGETLEVLVEERTRDGHGLGRTDDHRTVLFAGSAEPGAFVPIRIESASASGLRGRALVAVAAEGTR